MSHASSSSLKGKRKRKRNLKEKKSRKIDKRKRKMLVLKHSITPSLFCLPLSVLYNLICSHKS